MNSVVQLFSKTTGELLLLSHASGFTSVNPSVNFWKNLHYKLSLAHFSILFLTVLTQLNKVSASVILALLSLLSVGSVKYSLYFLLVRSPDVICSMVTLEHFEVM